MEGHGEEAVEGRGAEAAVDKVAVDGDAVVVDEVANAVDRAAVGKAAFDVAAVVEAAVVADAVDKAAVVGTAAAVDEVAVDGEAVDKAAGDGEAVVKAAVEGKSGGDNHFSLQTTSTPDHHSLPQTTSPHC